MTIQDYTGLYRTIHDYTGLYRTIQDYIGLYRTIQDYTKLHIKMGDRQTDRHTHTQTHRNNNFLIDCRISGLRAPVRRQTFLRRN